MSQRSESIKALRQMNDEELVVHLRQQRRKLFEVRFQQATGQVENHRLIRDLRREIGRTMTVQIELQRLPLVTEEPTGPTPRRIPPVRAPRESPRPVPSVAAAPSASTEEAAAEPVARPRRRSRARATEEPLVEAAAADDEKQKAETDA